MDGAPAFAKPRIGDPVPRKEDLRLLTGRGAFSDEFDLDGQVYAAMVRSPRAYARIGEIGVSDAPADLGVRHIEMPATPERVWRAIRDTRHAEGEIA